ncbi:cold-shock protein [Deinococcus cellulosilyticus]|uniref:CSD domain-containing protein n=1 Tax=Deinococcus cellulosilyticus (strain DSM 18568 / NBRC 106333 / KACC 11606 / 5516J-15) TaxID=1223518 RepID=A0A511NBM0_DEIC1|nr:cold shock domain-containing protein [Deinococcus cellulosilyticus]GEM50173.1 hypothetical protein DC3_58080 [Deinococcus cellulosilyticus NBRC 106333 = KACC 11606]
MAAGTVKWSSAEKGSGFISSEGTPDLFAPCGAHKSSGFKRPNEGHEVEFDVQAGQNGKGSQTASLTQLRWVHGRPVEVRTRPCSAFG